MEKQLSEVTEIVNKVAELSGTTEVLKDTLKDSYKDGKRKTIILGLLITVLFATFVTAFAFIYSISVEFAAKQEVNEKRFYAFFEQFEFEGDSYIDGAVDGENNTQNQIINPK